MAKIYARKILAGEMILEAVPVRWRAAVRALCEEQSAQAEE